LDAYDNPVPALLQIEVIMNDTEMKTCTSHKYEVDCSNINNETGQKKWVKIWINQVGQFLQFKMKNNQAGARINVHAMIPGLQPVGRLI
jgi:hypothetical protein